MLRMALRVAGLALQIDARESGVRLSVPDCHTKFLVEGTKKQDGLPSLQGLHLRVRDGPLAAIRGWDPVACAPLVWRLWRREDGHMLFESLEQVPPSRHLVVDAGFRTGEIAGDFGHATRSRYPLQDMDILLLANWLAGWGDLILHAAGAVIDGDGYCFAGESGAGKSTIAAALAASGGAVLGEDTVILRCLDDTFWIFGTPWHTDPSRCSPAGAPLAKLFFPDRAAAHGAVPCSPLQGVSRLMRTAFVPYYRPDAVAHILDNLGLLAERVPFFTLNHNLGEDILPLLNPAHRCTAPG